MLPTHGRYEYRPILGRPDYHWPGGARLAVYVAINLEAFPFGEGLLATAEALPPQSAPPDVVNFSWRDYGNRVGVWRLLALLDECALPAAALVNTAMYDMCPAVVEAFRARGDEIIGHGRTNGERQGSMAPAQEQALIAQATARIAAEEGAPPSGWLGPWVSESRITPDLLQRAGYRYVLDWGADDQPIWLAAGDGRILSIPYPKPVNDISAVLRNAITPRDWADMLVDQFDEMLAQSAAQPLVFSLSLHPYLVGQPYCLRPFRAALRHIATRRPAIWHTRPNEIARHAETLGDLIS